MKITLSYLKEKTDCKEWLDFFARIFGKSAVLKNKELLLMGKEGVDPEFVSWLIENYEGCQNIKIVKFYKKLRPSYISSQMLIMSCPFCQKKEIQDILLEER